VVILISAAGNQRSTPHLAQRGWGSCVAKGYQELLSSALLLSEWVVPQRFELPTSVTKPLLYPMSYRGGTCKIIVSYEINGSLISHTG